VVPRAIQHRVDALAVWRFNETAPRADGVRQTSNDGGTVNMLQSVVVAGIWLSLDCLNTSIKND